MHGRLTGIVSAHSFLYILGMFNIVTTIKTLEDICEVVGFHLIGALRQAQGIRLALPIAGLP